MYDPRPSEAPADEGLGLLNDTPGSLPQDTHNISQPPGLQSPPPRARTPPFSPNTRPSPGRTVRELAHKLSQQNIQLGGYGSSQSQPQQQPLPQLISDASSIITQQPPPPPPPPAPGSSVLLGLTNLPDLPAPQSWPMLEVDDAPEAFEENHAQDPPHLSLLSVARRRSQLLRGEGSSTGAGERVLSRGAGTRLRKQLSSQFHDKPINALANNARVEEMISTGTQCNVQSPPPASGQTPTLSPSPAVSGDPNYVFSPMVLEVDDAYVNGTADIFEEDLSFVETIVSLRRAGAPGGVRKQIVAGVPLRYQLSADAALRCQTVVKSRPRMRKRKKVRADNSIASSAVTSAVSSPVIPPSIPSPHLNPYG